MTWSPSDRPASSPPACFVLKPKVASQAEQTKLDTQFWLGKNAWGTWTLLCEQVWEGLDPLGDAKLDRAARFVNSRTAGPIKTATMRSSHDGHVHGDGLYKENYLDRSRQLLLQGLDDGFGKALHFLQLRAELQRQ